MKEVVIWIRQNTDWLYVKILETNIFFIDYWSFAHFSSGILLYLFLVNFKSKWQIIITILILYEVLEIITIYFALNVFYPETIKDQFTDILIGILGSIFQLKLLSFVNQFDSKTKSKILINYSVIFISFQISFWWVGFYGYKYNFESLNSTGLNVSSFLAWFIGLLILYNIHINIKNLLKNKILSFLTTYIVYLLLLFTYEYLTYNLLSIKEIGHKNKNALLFNLIHGSSILHYVYMIMPIIFFTSCKLFRKALIK